MASPQIAKGSEQVPPAQETSRTQQTSLVESVVHDERGWKAITLNFDENDNTAIRTEKTKELLEQIKATRAQVSDLYGVSDAEMVELLLTKACGAYQLKVDAIKRKPVHEPQDFQDLIEAWDGMQTLMFGVVRCWNENTLPACCRVCDERTAALDSREQAFAKLDIDLLMRAEEGLVLDNTQKKAQKTLDKDQKMLVKELKRLNKDRQDVIRDRKRLDETKLQISDDRKKWEEERVAMSDERGKLKEMGYTIKSDKMKLDKATEELERRKQEWKAQCVAKFSAEKKAITDDRAKLQADRQIMDHRDIDITRREEAMEMIAAELVEKQTALTKEQADWKARDVDFGKRVAEFERDVAEWDLNLARLEDSQAKAKAAQLQLDRDHKQLEKDRLKWAPQVERALELDEKMERREQAVTKRELEVEQREIRVASGVSKSAEKKLQKREEALSKAQYDLEEREAHLKASRNELHERESERASGRVAVIVTEFEREMASRERKVEDREFEVQMAEDSIGLRESIVRKREQRLLEKEKSITP